MGSVTSKAVTLCLTTLGLVLVVNASGQDQGQPAEPSGRPVGYPACRPLRISPLAVHGPAIPYLDIVIGLNRSMRKHATVRKPVRSSANLWFSSVPGCERLPRRFSLDAGMRRVSNVCSGEPGEVPDNEVNTHLGNPGCAVVTGEGHGRRSKAQRVPGDPDSVPGG